MQVSVKQSKYPWVRPAIRGFIHVIKMRMGCSDAARAGNFVVELFLENLRLHGLVFRIQKRKKPARHPELNREGSRALLDTFFSQALRIPVAFINGNLASSVRKNNPYFEHPSIFVL